MALLWAIATAVLTTVMAPALHAETTPVPPDFTVENAENVFPVSERSGIGTLTLKLSGDVADKEECQLDLKPVPAPLLPRLPNGFSAQLLAKLPHARTWLVSFPVEDIPHSAQPIARRFVASYCDYAKVIGYTLQSGPPPTFIWTLSPLKPQRWDGESPLPLTVSVGARSASSVRLVAPQLIDRQMHAASPDFLLCETRDKPCDGGPLSLSANTVRDLWIRRSAGAEAPPPGEYSGSIRLVAAEKPEGDAFDTTFYVSNCSARIGGALLIGLGVLLSSGVVGWLRRRADRLALLRPLALLEEQLAALRADLMARAQTSKRKFTHTDVELETTTTNLDNARRLLPDAWRFWTSPADAGVAPSYQETLANEAKRLGSLTIIVRQGLAQALADLRPDLPPNEVSLVDAALAAIDRLSTGELSDHPAVAQAVRAQLDKLAGQLAAARDKQDDGGGAKVRFSSESINFQLGLVSAGGWLIFAILTTLVGLYALVLDDPDFGQAKDLVLCLLWGFGLPTAGEGLSRLTPGSIGQSLGLQMTRAVS